jgi:hypothetical protein
VVFTRSCVSCTLCYTSVFGNLLGHFSIV